MQTIEQEALEDYKKSYSHIKREIAMQSGSEKELYDYVEGLISMGAKSYSAITIEDKLGFVAKIILNTSADEQINFMAENRHLPEFLYNFLGFCLSNNLEHRIEKKEEAFNSLCTMATSYYENIEIVKVENGVKIIEPFNKLEHIFNEVLTYQLNDRKYDDSLERPSSRGRS